MSLTKRSKTVTLTTETRQYLRKKHVYLVSNYIVLLQKCTHNYAFRSDHFRFIWVVFQYAVVSAIQFKHFFQSFSVTHSNTKMNVLISSCLYELFTGCFYNSHP